MITNSVLLLIAYLIDIWIVIYWIKSSNCESAKWPPQRIKKIVLRTAIIYLVLGLICWLFQFDALDTMLLLLGLILGFLMLVFFGACLSFDLVLVFIFDDLIKWLFDIPSVEVLFPSSKPYEHPDSNLTHLIGKTACVVSTLRPTGEIHINDQKYVATSETDFIEKGTSVTVVAIKNSNLIVRDVEEQGRVGS
ncbi:MAG: NfeD family protein [Planctomycetota bacterium]|jgi:membrane protein implicated in regulation of membrane protease activity